MEQVPGPVALAGSGEFLPAMEAVDRALIRGRTPRAAILPTASALEGDERVAYWLDLANRHYEAMEVEPVPVPVRDRADADDPSLASLLSDVGLVYLSGGDPHHLSNTLRSTLVWEAVLAAWRAGAALAGCSAGAMALTAGAPALRRPLTESPPSPLSDEEPTVVDGLVNGLGVVPGLAVVPHFDMIERWRPGTIGRFTDWRPPEVVLVGIDERTAVVQSGDGWRVEGAGSAWVIEQQGRRAVGAGEELSLPEPVG